jgi:transposase
MLQSHKIRSELLAEMTPAVRAFVTPLLARLSSLLVRLEASERHVAELEKENRELRQRSGMNPGNSSMPPPSDRPQLAPTKVKKTSTGKKRGGQAGHVKRGRELIPTEQCDKVENHAPRSCDFWGIRLARSDQNPRRHQVTEILQTKPTIAPRRVRRM